MRIMIEVLNTVLVNKYIKIGRLFQVIGVHYKNFCSNMRIYRCSLSKDATKPRQLSVVKIVLSLLRFRYFLYVMATEMIMK